MREVFKISASSKLLFVIVAVLEHWIPQTYASNVTMAPTTTAAPLPNKIGDVWNFGTAGRYTYNYTSPKSVSYFPTADGLIVIYQEGIDQWQLKDNSSFILTRSCSNIDFKPHQKTAARLVPGTNLLALQKRTHGGYLFLLDLDSCQVVLKRKESGADQAMTSTIGNVNYVILPYENMLRVYSWLGTDVQNAKITKISMPLYYQYLYTYRVSTAENSGTVACTDNSTALYFYNVHTNNQYPLISAKGRMDTVALNSWGTVAIAVVRSNQYNTTTLVAYRVSTGARLYTLPIMVSGATMTTYSSTEFVAISADGLSIGAVFVDYAGVKAFFKITTVVLPKISESLSGPQISETTVPCGFHDIRRVAMWFVKIGGAERFMIIDSAALLRMFTFDSVKKTWIQG